MVGSVEMMVKPVVGPECGGGGVMFQVCGE